MYSIYFIKKTEQNETTLRNSAVLQFVVPGVRGLTKSKSLKRS